MLLHFILNSCHITFAVVIQIMFFFCLYSYSPIWRRFRWRLSLFSQTLMVRRAFCLTRPLDWAAHYFKCTCATLQIMQPPLFALFPSSCFFHSDLSQDVASKGLGLVYEMGGEGDQQQLVSTLVETLMTGKRWADGRVKEAGIKRQRITGGSNVL